MRMLATAILATWAVCLWNVGFVTPSFEKRSLRGSIVARGAGPDGGAAGKKSASEGSWRRGIVGALAVTGAALSKLRPARAGQYPVQGSDDIMAAKSHGSTDRPVQEGLRWNVDWNTADRICSFNRHFAEYAGYWRSTAFLTEANREGETFYDSVTGKPLFEAPKGRTWEQFEKESKSHGWPSFRDEEVNWENVRCLPGGECVSVDGTHLGHNIPDSNGNRYCINLVSVAGKPRLIG
mmetsp:Transcript_87893/g.121975  ORF Transcript_87893/g.121975 Transcript_87893/m.121975 type:complete len:237 (-) Transcript_87893:41-751(-)